MHGLQNRIIHFIRAFCRNPNFYKNLKQIWVQIWSKWMSEPYSPADFKKNFQKYFFKGEGGGVPSVYYYQKFTHCPLSEFTVEISYCYNVREPSLSNPRPFQKILVSPLPPFHIRRQSLKKFEFQSCNGTRKFEMSGLY